MSIKVVLNNGKEESVPSYALNYLIANKKIIAFRRSDGWVRIGADKIRSSHPNSMCLLDQGKRDIDKLFVRSHS